MDPQSPRPTPAPSGRPAEPAHEWRGLARLRDRVERAAREIERLRVENAALAQRVLDLEDARKGGGSGPALFEGADPDSLRDKVQGFIDTIDRVLRDGPDSASASGDGAPPSDAP